MTSLHSRQQVWILVQEVCQNGVLSTTGLDILVQEVCQNGVLSTTGLDPCTGSMSERCSIDNMFGSLCRKYVRTVLYRQHVWILVQEVCQNGVLSTTGLDHCAGSVSERCCIDNRFGSLCRKYVRTVFYRQQLWILVQEVCQNGVLSTTGLDILVQEVCQNGVLSTTGLDPCAGSMSERCSIDNRFGSLCRKYVRTVFYRQQVLDILVQEVCQNGVLSTTGLDILVQEVCQNGILSTTGLDPCAGSMSERCSIDNRFGHPCAGSVSERCSIDNRFGSLCRKYVRTVFYRQQVWILVQEVCQNGVLSTTGLDILVQEVCQSGVLSKQVWTSLCRKYVRTVLYRQQVWTSLCRKYVRTVLYRQHVWILVQEVCQNGVLSTTGLDPCAGSMSELCCIDNRFGHPCAGSMSERCSIETGLDILVQEVCQSGVLSTTGLDPCAGSMSELCCIDNRFGHPCAGSMSELCCIDNMFGSLYRKYVRTVFYRQQVWIIVQEVCQNCVVWTTGLDPCTGSVSERCCIDNRFGSLCRKYVRTVFYRQQVWIIVQEVCQNGVLSTTGLDPCAGSMSERCCIDNMFGSLCRKYVRTVFYRQQVWILVQEVCQNGVLSTTGLDILVQEVCQNGVLSTTGLDPCAGSMSERCSIDNRFGSLCRKYVRTVFYRQQVLDILVQEVCQNGVLSTTGLDILVQEVCQNGILSTTGLDPCAGSMSERCSIDNRFGHPCAGSVSERCSIDNRFGSLCRKYVRTVFYRQQVWILVQEVCQNGVLSTTGLDILVQEVCQSGVLSKQVWTSLCRKYVRTVLYRQQVWTSLCRKYVRTVLYRQHVWILVQEVCQNGVLSTTGLDPCAGSMSELCCIDNRFGHPCAGSMSERCSIETGLDILVQEVCQSGVLSTTGLDPCAGSMSELCCIDNRFGHPCAGSMSELCCIDNMFGSLYRKYVRTVFYRQQVWIIVQEVCQNCVVWTTGLDPCTGSVSERCCIDNRFGSLCRKYVRTVFYRQQVWIIVQEVCQNGVLSTTGLDPCAGSMSERCCIDNMFGSLCRKYVRTVFYRQQVWILVQEVCQNGVLSTTGLDILVQEVCQNGVVSTTGLDPCAGSMSERCSIDNRFGSLCRKCVRTVFYRQQVWILVQEVCQNGVLSTTGLDPCAGSMSELCCIDNRFGHPCAGSMSERCSIETGLDILVQEVCQSGVLSTTGLDPCAGSMSERCSIDNRFGSLCRKCVRTVLYRQQVWTSLCRKYVRAVFYRQQVWTSLCRKYVRAVFYRQQVWILVQEICQNCVVSTTGLDPCTGSVSERCCIDNMFGSLYRKYVRTVFYRQQVWIIVQEVCQNGVLSTTALDPCAGSMSERCSIDNRFGHPCVGCMSERCSIDNRFGSLCRKYVTTAFLLTAMDASKIKILSTTNGNKYKH